MKSCKEYDERTIDVVATDGVRLTITIILLLSISITHGGCV